jgi:DNA-binding SARP family transcriptional activator
MAASSSRALSPGCRVALGHDLAVRYRVLGPVEVVGDHGPVALRSASQRLLLALLLAADGAFVTADRLAEDLWGDDQPSGPTGALQTHVSRLRRVLPDPASLETGPSGYRLVDPEDTDRRAFEVLVARATEARAGGDLAGALDALEEALTLWRGDAFADVADHPSLGRSPPAWTTRGCGPRRTASSS